MYKFFYFILFPFFLLISEAVSSSELKVNYALSFNGKDQQVDLFMKPLLNNWTVSAWVKKEADWQAGEVIIGSGWITVEEWEDYPLHFCQGKLCAVKTGVTAPKVLSKGWHHIASSWDGDTTRLFVDGVQVAQKNSGRPINPAFIGSADGEKYFKGMIDEVQIWNVAITANDLKAWMNKAITSNHPYYKNLIAYYQFDDRARDATDYKGCNKGDIKTYFKTKAKSSGPKYVANNNTQFKTNKANMKVLSALSLQSPLGAHVGSKNVELLKIKINVEGSSTPLVLSDLLLKFNPIIRLKDFTQLKLLSLGPDAEYTKNKRLVAQVKVNSHLLSFKGKMKEQVQLKTGVNYFAITVDLADTAKAGNIIDVEVVNMSLSNSNIIPTTDYKAAQKKIIALEKTNDEVKLLNWNIWHGGKEKGKDLGPYQVAEIIRASDADVITMVETYGSGQRIAEQLGFHFYQPYDNSNLSILSRFPIIDTYKSNKHDFYSTGVKVKTANDREVLIWGIWIRYWGPDYTLQQYSQKYTALDWIQGDREKPMADLAEILAKDIAEFHTDKSMPLIFAGDFNSGSHLDFTQRAAKSGLHNGWVVDFPTSKLMFEQGFKDSFRELHPDEVSQHGGTWAAIYNWSSDFRIDYIYYKGDGIQATESKVIDQHIHADIIWPSDHSALLTSFKISN